MRVIEPGHQYLLDVIDGELDVVLTFVKRDEPKAKYPGNIGHHPGTIIQEVLRALIDRLKYVHSQVGCWEDGQAIYKLRDVLRVLELRAARLHDEHEVVPKLYETLNIETVAPCPECGHIHFKARDAKWHEQQRNRVPDAGH
jgi:hypothetical protein